MRRSCMPQCTHYYAVPENFLSCAVPENSSAAVSTSLRAVRVVHLTRITGLVQIREHSAGLLHFVRRHVKIRLGRFKIALVLGELVLELSKTATRRFCDGRLIGHLAQACLELALLRLALFCAVSLNLLERLVTEALALALV